MIRSEKAEKNRIVKKVVLFMFIMAIICLIFMIAVTIISNKTQMYIDLDTLELVQLEPPKEGDMIAIINTSLGEIRAVLYPEYSPAAVKNFVDLANSGYYDNTYVFYSEEGAFAAAGCPNKDGTLPYGYDQSKELVEQELHQNMWPFRGAICSMTTSVDETFWNSLFGGGTYYCGSRFLLVNTIEFTDEIKKILYENTPDNPELPDAFIENGGIPNFSQQITIIGQAYEGLDVIELLSYLDMKDNGETKIPIDDVMILSIVIDKYSARSPK